MKKGFTIIEILVVISIGALLVTMGISSYSQFNRRQVLDQTAKTILNDLRFIQSKASAGDKGPAGTCTNKTLTGWYFEILNVNPLNQYRTYGLCAATEFDSKTTTLPVNLSFITPGAGVKILFKPLNLGIDNNYSLVLQFGNDSNEQKSIGLTKSGTIQTTTVAGVISPVNPTPTPTKEMLPIPTSACFLAGTEVTTIKNRFYQQKPIEKINVDDKIISFNPFNKILSSSTVLNIYVTEANNYYRLSTAEAEVNVTSDHPFLTTGGIFKKVKNLQIGETVYLLCNRFLCEQKIIAKELITKKVIVYNLSVNGNNTFFANGFAVHNKQTGPIVPPPLNN